MDTPHDPTRVEALCPSCGVPLPPDESSCAACGRRLALAPAPAAAVLAATPAPAATVAAEAEVTAPVAAVQPAETLASAAAAEPAATAGAIQAGRRICDWCGAANPASAARCETCGASFPRPEQDDLLSRASAERVRLALGEIEMRERLRAPWWKRLFGGKTT